MRLRIAKSALGCASVLLAQPVFAQEDAPLPPRLDDTEPGQALLAPLPNDREEELEEVVVVGEIRWRLPDLGSSWRGESEQDQPARLAVDFVPLYDPEMAQTVPDLFQFSKQDERIGYLELFRISFGARPE